MLKGKPLGIKLISIILGINGFGCVIMSIVFFFYFLIKWHRINEDSIIFLMLGILLASLSIGLIKLRNWARITTAILFLINAVTITIWTIRNAFRIILGSEIGAAFFLGINIVLAIWIFRYLLSEKIKILFTTSNIQPASNISASEPIIRTKVSESKINCPNCGTENLVSSNYCISCGSKLDLREEIVGAKARELIICLKCGLEVSQGVKFCKYCGTRIKVAVIKKEDILPKCPTCKSIVSSTAKFCKYCGFKLK